MKIAFSPDRPIESAQQDLLGRSPFASLIAEMISRWRQRECLVIALYGAWGSGKSSVKNLILERIAEEKYRLAPIELGLKGVSQEFLTEMLVYALSSRWLFPAFVFRPKYGMKAMR